MVKIKPLPAESNFDGLDELHNVDYHLHRGTKSSKRIKKKQTTRIDDGTAKHNSVVDVLKTLLVGTHSVHIGAPFLCVGLFLSMVLQLMPHVQRYNTVLMPALAAAVEYKHFPQNSVRPQVLIALAILLSIGMDIFQIANDRTNITPVIVATIVLINMCKIALLNTFLRNSQGAVRTRKYLKRRFRLFIIPLKEPRRIMRDIRGRMLAIGMFQLIGALVFFATFLVQVTYLEYSSMYLSPARGDSALPMFLIIKVGTLLLVFFGVLYDTDIRLCLWYFGCLGFAVQYVRKYITRKRLELGGFPLSFVFSKMRFQVLCFVKAVDVLWGIYGWVIVSYPLGGKFYSLDTHLQILYGMVTFSLVVFDIWSVTLLLGVRWLLRRRKVVKELGELADSDDSEIEEFGLRTNLEEGRQHLSNKAELAETRRRLYLHKMKEEQTRFAEGTVDERHRGSRAAADWIQEFSAWAPRGKSRGVHPDAGSDPSVEAADWEAGSVLRSKQQGNPLMRQLQEHAGFNYVARKFPQNPSVWEDLQAAPTGLQEPVVSKFPRHERVEQLDSFRPPPEATATSQDSRQSSKDVPRTVARTPTKPTAQLKKTVYDIDWVDDSDDDGADASGEAVLSPLLNAAPVRKHTAPHALLPRGYSDYQVGYTKNKDGSRETFKSPSSMDFRTSIGVQDVELEPTPPMPAEQFAEIWEVLAPASVAKISTMLVPTQVPMKPSQKGGSDEESAVDSRETAATDKQMRTEQQNLLSAIIKHVRDKNFCVVAAGVHQQQVLKLLCCGTIRPPTGAPGNPSRSSEAAGRMGLVEIKLFRGAIMGGGAGGTNQSYLIECTARSKDAQQAQMFLQLMEFRSIFTFID